MHKGEKWPPYFQLVMFLIKSKLPHQAQELPRASSSTRKSLLAGGACLKLGFAKLSGVARRTVFLTYASASMSGSSGAAQILMPGSLSIAAAQTAEPAISCAVGVVESETQA